MPEYLSVMTYLKCSQDEMLPQYMQQYREVLERLGYAGEDVTDLLTQIHWEEDNIGFGYALDHEVPLQHIQLSGHPLYAKPITAGWTSETFPDLQEPWVAIELACETQTLRQDLDNVSSFSRTYFEEHRYRLVHSGGNTSMIE